MTISNEMLISLRKDRGWSQEKLSIISGISQRTIQRIEHDGSTCSLETKLALASAFEVSPTKLTSSSDVIDSEVYISDKSGLFGLLILFFIASLTYLITDPFNRFSFLMIIPVLFIAIVMSITNYGAYETYKLFYNSHWLVRYPKYVSGLNNYISQAQVLIKNVYTSSFIIVLVSVASSIQQTGFLLTPSLFVDFSIRAVVIAVIFVEFWLRPYKRKMEKMLAYQCAGNKNIISR